MSYLCPHSCEGKTEYGYCRYTWCVNPLHSNLGTAYQLQGVQRAVITNADRIRSMTDEGLAEFLTSEDMCELICSPAPPHCDGQCKQKMLDWLKQEESK